MGYFKTLTRIADVKAISKGKVVKRAVRKKAIKSVIRWTK